MVPNGAQLYIYLLRIFAETLESMQGISKAKHGYILVRMSTRQYHIESSNNARLLLPGFTLQVPLSNQDRTPVQGPNLHPQRNSAHDYHIRLGERIGFTNHRKFQPAGFLDTDRSKGSL